MAGCCWREFRCCVAITGRGNDVLPSQLTVTPRLESMRPHPNNRDAYIRTGTISTAGFADNHTSERRTHTLLTPWAYARRQSSRIRLEMLGGPPPRSRSTVQTLFTDVTRVAPPEKS